jgi:hypothetical protein
VRVPCVRRGTCVGGYSVGILCVSGVLCGVPCVWTSTVWGYCVGYCVGILCGILCVSGVPDVLKGGGFADCLFWDLATDI